MYNKAVNPAHNRSLGRAPVILALMSAVVDRDPDQHSDCLMVSYVL